MGNGELKQVSQRILEVRRRLRECDVISIFSYGTWKAKENNPKKGSWVRDRMRWQFARVLDNFKMKEDVIVEDCGEEDNSALLDGIYKGWETMSYTHKECVEFWLGGEEKKEFSNPSHRRYELVIMTDGEENCSRRFISEIESVMETPQIPNFNCTVVLFRENKKPEILKDMVKLRNFRVIEESDIDDLIFRMKDMQRNVNVVTRKVEARYEEEVHDFGRDDDVDTPNNRPRKDPRGPKRRIDRNDRSVEPYHRGGGRRKIRNEGRVSPHPRHKKIKGPPRHNHRPRKGSGNQPRHPRSPPPPQNNHNQKKKKGSFKHFVSPKLNQEPRRGPPGRKRQNNIPKKPKRKQYAIIDEDYIDEKKEKKEDHDEPEDEGEEGETKEIEIVTERYVPKKKKTNIEADNNNSGKGNYKRKRYNSGIGGGYKSRSNPTTPTGNYQKKTTPTGNYQKKTTQTGNYQRPQGGGSRTPKGNYRPSGGGFGGKKGNYNRRQGGVGNYQRPSGGDRRGNYSRNNNNNDNRGGGGGGNKSGGGRYKIFGNY